MKNFRMLWKKSPKKNILNKMHKIIIILILNHAEFRKVIFSNLNLKNLFR